MGELAKIIKAHFIHPEDGMVCKTQIHFAPRVGDELRFSDDCFYKVVRLVWIFDEPEAHFTRLNIEVGDIEAQS